MSTGGPPFAYLTKKRVPHSLGFARDRLFAESAVLFFCARSKGWACDVVEAFTERIFKARPGTISRPPPHRANTGRVGDPVAGTAAGEGEI